MTSPPCNQPPFSAESLADGQTTVLDLFAGPGGWDIGAASLGIPTIGVEKDATTCDTRRAAGLPTVQADVTRLPLDITDLHGLIASPPCQTFSAAGKGSGRRAMEDVLLAVGLTARGLPICEFDDPRTALVVQPLRYALELEPEWIAWEQVPQVLPVWQACAEVLRRDGYSVWTGNAQAEQYGVPQTRKRAILMASRTREMTGPPPTHRKYRKGVAQHDGDPSLRPWVSMAEALGLVGDGILRSNYGTGGDPRKRGERRFDEPAATITSKIDRYTVLRNNTSANACVRPVTEPAPTLYFGARMNGVYWEPAMQGAGPAAELTAGQKPRLLTESSHAITGAATAQWVDPRRPPAQRRDGSIRVTVEEAGILQSFPAGYPWQGKPTSQYQQVGNAIPPLLAEHVLSSVTGIALAQEAAA